MGLLKPWLRWKRFPRLLWAISAQPSRPHLSSLTWAPALSVLRRPKAQNPSEVSSYLIFTSAFEGGNDRLSAERPLSGGPTVNVALISSSYPPPPDALLRRARDPDDSSPLYLQGGIATHVAQLAEALTERGHSVKVFAWSPRFDEVSHENGVLVCRLSIQNRVTDSAYPTTEEIPIIEKRFLDRIRELILAPVDYPDVIHCHHSFAFPAAAGLRQVTKARLLSTAHILMCSPAFPYGGDVPLGTRESERRMCCLSDHVIAVSGWVRRSIIEQFDLSPSHIEVVHNGIGTDQPVLSHMTVAEWRSRFAANGENVVAYAGRLSAEKGIAGFMEAMRLVIRDVPSTRIVVAGGYANEIQAIKTQLANDAVLLDHVAFLGWISPKELYYLRAIADAIVMPSLYDPFPYAALESMAAGVPLVCSDAGGLPEMIEHGVSGLVVPLRNIDGRSEVDSRGVASSVLALLKDQQLRRRLAESARKRVVQHFDIQTMVSKVSSIYQN